MIKNLYKHLPWIVLLIYCLIVFRPFIFQKLLPIPADTIVGLYHPWRDLYSDTNPNGIPYKNPLITDAVRQQYPWRELAISELKKGIWPNWNPYSFSGYPLSANIQSAPFYPLNLIFWLTDFPMGWSILVMLQVVLGFVFMKLFLENHGLAPESVSVGALSWASSGFFISWLTSNTVIHTILWLPLVLLAIDKIFSSRRNFIWCLILVFSISSSLLAGHLQSFFYVMIASGLYLLLKFVKQKRLVPTLLSFLSIGSGVLILFWWIIPVINFILLSARNIDQSVWQKPDWFLPWQNLVQFIAPDFFGNPATMNYFGVWNYAEFVGYIGIVGLFCVFYVFLGRKTPIYFLLLTAVGLIMALPNSISAIPFKLNLPFYSTAQPSRIISLVCFGLSGMAAFGMDNLVKSKFNIKKTLLPLAIIILLIVSLWMYSLINHLGISQKNLILPSITIIILGVVLIFGHFVSNKSKLFLTAIIVVLSISVIDLARFTTKFIPFVKSDYLYPETKILNLLKEKSKTETFRIVRVDNVIAESNLLIPSRIQSVSGYDPLYLTRYAEFITALDRNKPDINPPYGFNRAIDPRNLDNKLYKLLNVKYLLTIYSIYSDKYKFVESEGKTKLYEVVDYLPRIFSVKNLWLSKSKQESIDFMYKPNYDPKAVAVVEDAGSDQDLNEEYSEVKIKNVDYKTNEINFETSGGPGFIVITDNYYPGWKAEIDGYLSKIYLTDFTFRGIKIPQGEHKIKFKYDLYPY